MPPQGLECRDDNRTRTMLPHLDRGGGELSIILTTRSSWLAHKIAIAPSAGDALPVRRSDCASGGPAIEE
jgi:hypothetical protein